MEEYDPGYAPMSLDEAYLDITEYMEGRNADTQQNKSVGRDRIRYCGECLCWLPRFERGTETCDAFDGNVSKDKCGKCDKECIIMKDTVSFGNGIEDVVCEMRFRIEQKTGLTASAGIAPNGLLAKICSDKNKPNGQFYLEPEREKIIQFIKDLPVRKVPGIGAVCDSLLRGMGVATCGDLYEKRAELDLLHSDIQSKFFLRVSLGIGSTFISNDSDRKSISVERTFNEKRSPEDLLNLCEDLSQSLADDVAEKNISGRTVTLKYKTVEFDVKTRANSAQRLIRNFEDIFHLAKELLLTEIKAHGGDLRLRLMGVRLSNLEDATIAKTSEITKFIHFNENLESTSKEDGMDIENKKITNTTDSAQDLTSSTSVEKETKESKAVYQKKQYQWLKLSKFSVVA